MNKVALVRLINRIPGPEVQRLLRSVGATLGEEPRRQLFDILVDDSPEGLPTAAKAADMYWGMEVAPDWDMVRGFFGLDFSFQYSAMQALAYMADYLVAEDRELNGEGLDDKYNPEGDGEHPEWSRFAWRTAVAAEETISGYWDWVQHKLRE